MHIFMTPPKPIHSCGSYEPYWIKDEYGEKVRNPKINDISRKLMDLKDDKNRGHSAAISYFSKLLSQKIVEYRLNYYTPPRQTGVAIILVPSSQQGRISPALDEIASYVSRQHNLHYFNPPVLNRTKTIQKLHSGGDRSIGVHLTSIAVDPSNISYLKYMRIILVDDVSTTGGSLRGCLQMLEAAGIDSQNIELISLLTTA